MTVGIYIITNNKTRKQYVGQSVNIERRIRQHKSLYDIETSYLEKSIRKHGWENFTWNILWRCSEKELDDEERKFINLYGTYGGGYNLTRGGELNGIGNPMRNPELLEKNKKARKGYKATQETKLKISKNQSKTGIFRVIKSYDNRLKQGFEYRYDYRSNKNRKRIRATNIMILKRKVEAKHLEWIIVDETLANKTLEESNYYAKQFVKEHTTGYYRVNKCNDETYILGYYYRYNHRENGKTVNVQATTIDKLKEKVLAKGWDWFKIDEYAGVY